MAPKSGPLYAIEISAGIIGSLENDGVAGHGHRNERGRNGVMHCAVIYCLSCGPERANIKLMSMTVLVSE